MDPAEVIELIKRGNESFFSHHAPDYFAPLRDSQHPKVTLLTCSDARVHSDAVIQDPFDTIFSVENIGNQVKTCEGSLDYGILVLKTPVLLILGHSDCGAIKAWEKHCSTTPASIRRELDSLGPAFTGFDPGGDLPDRIVRNIEYQTGIALQRYVRQIEEGSLAVVGAYYDFADDFGQGPGRTIFLSVNGQKIVF